MVMACHYETSEKVLHFRLLSSAHRMIDVTQLFSQLLVVLFDPCDPTLFRPPQHLFGKR